MNPGAPNPGALSPGTLSPGTLSRQLVTRVTALVAAVAILLSGLTVLATYLILFQQLDQQLQGRIVLTPRDEEPRRGQGAGGPGLQQGFLIYFEGRGWVQDGRDRVLLSDEQVWTLAQVPAGHDAFSINLPDLGAYRVATTARGILIGLPLEPTQRVVLGIAAAAGTLTLLAVLASFLVTRGVVARSLRPLARMAATATAVSRLDLESGDAAVPMRIAASDIELQSEVGQVGIAFNHMLDNVESALSGRQRSETKLRQFVADASHELRNPLASIRGYAELTRHGRADLPEDTRHALARIESESERMSLLVEDLLLLARLDSGPALAWAPVDLGEVVANAVSDTQAAGPDHHWILALPPVEVLVAGDANRLAQVVVNLLANARKHTPVGTSVAVSLAVEGRQAVLRVIDNGPGVPEGIRDRVFERFTRADASRSRDGEVNTGLGLAIVAAVVSAHAGVVEVDSPPGKGATFTVRLPLLAPAQP